MKSKVEFTDEELAQIAELVSENFEVYGLDPDSHGIAEHFQENYRLRME